MESKNDWKKRNDDLGISGIGSPRFVSKRSDYSKYNRESKADIFK